MVAPRTAPAGDGEYTAPSVTHSPDAESTLPPPSTSGSRVVRNSGLTLLGVGIPLFSAFLVMPSLARHLGQARFGVLGLAWALLEYFSLFDIGLGRATTKFVAERLGRRSAELPRIILVSVTAQWLLGALAGLILALLTPLLVDHVLSVPPELRAETRSSFLLLALMVPFVLVSLGLRGVLEAAQRFDLSTVIRIPSGAATFLVPALAAFEGVRLPGILILLLVTRIITCGALLLAVRRALTGVTWSLRIRWRLPRELVSFGGWIAVTNVVSPVLVYFDRFALGAVVGLGAVGMYTPAYELTSRLLILPGSLITALFPMVSAASTQVRGDQSQVARLFTLSLRHLLLVLAPAVLVLTVFAPDVLRLWLGQQFADQSATALRILALGVMLNGLSHIPCGYLQASGRPDIPAKFHLFEAAVHLPLTLLLVHSLGITGAALAWTLRVSLDGALLFSATDRVLGMSPVTVLTGRGARLAGALAALAVALLSITVARPLPALAVAAAGAVLAGFAYVVWSFVLDETERAMIHRVIALTRWRAADAPR